MKLSLWSDSLRLALTVGLCGGFTTFRYFGSQTWPFPSNIMVGFRAEYASGELTPDGEEVVESGWFDKDNLPEIPHKGSIARAMIDAWLEEQGES